MVKSKHSNHRGKRQFFHHNGNHDNKQDNKRQKRENAVKWRNARGDDPNNRSNFTLALNNPRFEAFYQSLGFLSEEEYPRFLKALHDPLPACFHMNPSYAFTDALKIQLHVIIDQITKNIALDGAKKAPLVETLKWYPHECGFKLSADKREIRKDDNLSQLHKWLILHTDNGNLTRQEAVSMVPPLALNVEPYHKCLDMCAAPGSKTSQLLEIVNRSLGQPDDQQGLVVANDADTNRCYMLVHQCRRIKSPLLLVTTHQGQSFPPMYGELDVDSAPMGFFDRVLCDVPCSGDGTLRKNPEIWSKWSVKNSHSLHSLQLHIAARGLFLLKPGGLMVYSTCSMSPYEDEAVVAELLRRNKDTLELVDAREFVPLFKARSGLHSWPVVDDDEAIRQEQQSKRMNESSSNSNSGLNASTSMISEVTKDSEFTKEPEDDQEKEKEENEDGDENEGDGTGGEDNIMEVEDEKEEKIASDDKNELFGINECKKLGMEFYTEFESLPENIRRRIKKSAFPPTVEEAQWMHLERCLRCVPHDEDTGGFFVATFRKIGSNIFQNSNSKQTSAAETNQSMNSQSHSSLEKNGTSILVDDVTEDDVDEMTTVVTISEETCVDKVIIEPESSESSLATSSANKNLSVKQNSNNDFANFRGNAEYLPLDKEIFDMIKVFYGLSDSITPNHLYIRKEIARFSKKRKNPFHNNTKNNDEDNDNENGNVDGNDDNEENDSQSAVGKSVYYISASASSAMTSDRTHRLKIVAAGMKVLERKLNVAGTGVEYRLVQEGIHLMAPHLKHRKVDFPIQDFCNLLEAGLVSLSTLHPNTMNSILKQPTGVLVCIYRYNKEDVIGRVLATSSSSSSSSDSSITAIETKENSNNNNNSSNNNLLNDSVQDGHIFYVMCWKGLSNAINVVCKKVEIDAIKHQLEALGVLRAKIGAWNLLSSTTSTIPPISSSTASDLPIDVSVVVNETEDVNTSYPSCLEG